jgi:hypothetical protein
VNRKRRRGEERRGEGNEIRKDKETERGQQRKQQEQQCVCVFFRQGYGSGF